MNVPAPVRVGLVGAGPWAEQVHAPMLAAGPETELVGVWTRRPEAATELAARWGVPAFPSYEALLDACEAVAFAVPPAVQAEFAATAARAGRGVLLEKPIAETLEDAAELVQIIEDAGVASVVTLTYRYAAKVREFVAEAQRHTFRGGRALFLTNAYLGGPFATPWRLAKGSILDIGPHAIDLLQTTISTVEAVTAVHGSKEWTAVTLEHAGGAVSQVSLCSHVAADPLRIEVGLFNEEVIRELDVIPAMGGIYGEALLGGTRLLADAEAFGSLRAEFAEAVRSGQPHELDARYGLHLQRVVVAAVQSINTGERVAIQ
ncbi:hypothetical protein BOH66_06320 [Microbacterium aurum]|uniref:Uncharacterized protein n=1 Tax=Microbacterium aurum TaxID=36805 RepID=A0A1P8U744_9MICO|nr:Gfo/Idh/MocA family oxidoreductase [Microbacterium aurum]APZ33914.1 hypothetical protein BOH66_06320 [Microbacterium aurum]MBM7827675.1 putative dehydrogenase [Microbacterium aurum]